MKELFIVCLKYREVENLPNDERFIMQKILQLIARNASRVALVSIVSLMTVGVLVPYGTVLFTVTAIPLLVLGIVASTILALEDIYHFQQRRLASCH